MKARSPSWAAARPLQFQFSELLDEQAEDIFKTTDEIAERVRKIGGVTLKSIGQIASLQRIRDNEADFVIPGDMLGELLADNKGRLWAASGR